MKKAAEPPAPRPSGRARSWSDLGWLAPASGLDLRLLGRTLMHAALVGGVAGAAGAAFFAALELGQHLLLGGLAGYAPLAAHGEGGLRELAMGSFRPWLLVLLPAAGGLVSGVLTARWAPEAAGGGGDATIDAYHRHGALLRRRVLAVKGVASVATLATGGSGGREGPTMLIGAAAGSLIGRLVPASPRERRILLVAGIAAGIAAVFRTPLGAALLAVEMLYRDDFESDALVPAILASVVSYSLSTTLFGASRTLFGRLPPFRFSPAELPLYVLLAIVVALASLLFVAALRAVRSAFGRSSLPPWARPAVGGLLTGGFAVAVLYALWTEWGETGRDLGVLGGGYGLVQAVLTGAPGLPVGWRLVLLLAALAVAKLVASALTIGSGGSAGDFAPSLVIGGLVGAAFGHAARLVLGIPDLHPEAFALVGMGTFYGGIAHVPLSALVLVAELAGSYDLLVPMMLAVGVAFVTLRGRTIYEAQPLTKRDSPVHARADHVLQVLTVGGCMIATERAPIPESETLRDALGGAVVPREQRAAAVVDARGRVRGLVDLAALQASADDPDLTWAIVADVMLPWVSLPPDASALEAVALLDGGLPQIPIVQGADVVGWVGHREIARGAARSAAAPSDSVAG